MQSIGWRQRPSCSTRHGHPCCNVPTWTATLEVRSFVVGSEPPGEVPTWGHEGRVRSRPHTRWVMPHVLLGDGRAARAISQTPTCRQQFEDESLVSRAGPRCGAFRPLRRAPLFRLRLRHSRNGLGRHCVCQRRQVAGRWAWRLLAPPVLRDDRRRSARPLRRPPAGRSLPHWPGLPLVGRRLLGGEGALARLDAGGCRGSGRLGARHGSQRRLGALHFLRAAEHDRRSLQPLFGRPAGTGDDCGRRRCVPCRGCAEPVAGGHGSGRGGAHGGGRLLGQGGSGAFPARRVPGLRALQRAACGKQDLAARRRNWGGRRRGGCGNDRHSSGHVVGRARLGSRIPLRERRRQH